MVLVYCVCQNTTLHIAITKPQGMLLLSLLLSLYKRSVNDCCFLQDHLMEHWTILNRRSYHSLHSHSTLNIVRNSVKKLLEETTLLAHQNPSMTKLVGWKKLHFKVLQKRGVDKSIFRPFQKISASNQILLYFRKASLKSWFVISGRFLRQLELVTV